MLGLAPSLGCASSTDYMCLCDSANFGYGVRDCSLEACPAGTDTNVIFQFLVGLCSGQFGSISSSATSGGTTATATGGSTVSGTPSAGSTGPNAAIAAVTVGVPYSSDASAFQSLSTAGGSPGGGSSSVGSGGVVGGVASSASGSASSG